MKFKKITAIILALALVFSFTTVNAFAGSYAKASVPVILTVSNEYRVVSVTVPASFPIAKTVFLHFFFLSCPEPEKCTWDL